MYQRFLKEVEENTIAYGTKDDVKDNSVPKNLKTCFHTVFTIEFFCQIF